MNLSQQISPYMTMVPDADQTFGQYVRELLATSKGFGGPFAGGQGSAEQPQQPKIVDGLFGKYLPQNEGGSGDYGGTPRGDVAPFGSAQSVLDLAKASEMLAHPAAKALGLFTGLPINALGKVADFAGNQSWNAFNDNFDRSMNAFDVAASLPGVGTISDKYGNVQSYTTPSMVAAADAGMFGIDYSAPGYSNETETMNDSFNSGGNGGVDTSGGGWGTGNDFGNGDYGSYI